MKPAFFKKYTVQPAAMLMLIAIALVKPAIASAIVSADCNDFINEQPARVTCGFIKLPLNHDNPDGQKIELPILIAQSTRSMLSASRRAVLIPGAGGPGASMGFGYAYYPGEFLQPYLSILQAGFDVVLLDQRGAGLASPQLTCFETLDAFKELISRDRTTDDEIQMYQDAATRCRARLEPAGVSFFDTDQSARDFLTVMSDLPYDWWGTIATSYATVIAQAMLLHKPGAFDRMVLDSPVPLDYQKPHTSESTYESIIKTIERCEMIALCHNRYPDLLDQFDEILARAAVKPYRINIKVTSDTNTRIKPRIVVDQHTLLAIFSNAIYSNESIAALPSVIAAVYRGRLNALRMFTEDFWYQSTDAEFADALNLTVHCKERLSLERQYQKENPQYLSRLSAESRKILQAQVEMCTVWNTGTNEHLIPKRKLNADTLVIAGSLDPVISAADISNTVDDLSNHTKTIIPNAGHAVWFQSECVRQAVVAFLDEQPIIAIEACIPNGSNFK